MVLDGIGYSFGILLKPLMEHFGVGKGLMSLVSALSVYQSLFYFLFMSLYLSVIYLSI